MRLAEETVQRRNPAPLCAGEDTGEKLIFCGAQEGISRTMKEHGGKLLLISDERTLGVFSEAACSPRAVSIVYDGDSLPLFSMPDGISCVLAAGGEETLLSARYFAEVRGIACALFPVCASLEGAFEAHAELEVGGLPAPVPLKDGTVFCDMELLRPTLGRAYGRLLLSGLAQFEARALFRFGMGRDLAQTEMPVRMPEEDVVRLNARQRLEERSGAPLGEGVVLARLLADRDSLPEWRAFVQLSALYAAFFEKGKPRRYFTPDYRARAERAGTPYSLSGVPSAEEYVVRAMTLERMRAEFARDILRLLAQRETYLAELRRWSKAELRGGGLDALSVLPEHCPNGLTAIIRDFGLMEWE